MTKSPDRTDRLNAHSLLTAVLGAVLGFAINLVAARSLGPAGKGVLDLAGSSAGLFALILGFSLNAGLTQYVAASGNAPRGMARTVWLWSLVSGLVVGGALFVFQEQAVRIGLLPSNDRAAWLVFIAICTTCGLGAATLRGVVIGRARLITANRIDLLIKALLLATYAITALVYANATARSFALASLPVIALLPLLLSVAQRGPEHIEQGALRTILTSTLPLHGANIVYFLNQRADLFFVQAYHGPAEVGIYSLAVSLAQTVLFLSSALAVPLLPQVASAASAVEATEATAAACRRFVLLGGTGAAVLATTAFWAVPFVFGHAFSTSLTPLFILLPGMLAYGLGNLLTSYFAGVNQNKINLRMAALGLLITIAGNFTLTRWLGSSGAALTSSLAYTSITLVALAIFSRTSGIALWRIVTPNRQTMKSAVEMLAHLRP